MDNKEYLLPGRIYVYQDEVAEKIDEIADLCECWKKNRDKGRTPTSIRAAIHISAEELIHLIENNS